MSVPRSWTGAPPEMRGIALEDRAEKSELARSTGNGNAGLTGVAPTAGESGFTAPDNEPQGAA